MRGATYWRLIKFNNGGEIMPELVKYQDGKKFMWDGLEYTTEDEAKNAATAYSADGFEVLNTAEDGKFFVYSRRVVEEVVVA